MATRKAAFERALTSTSWLATFWLRPFQLFKALPLCRRARMTLWRPDPTFYPSPKMAMQAPAEKLAFVVMLNGNQNSKPDALGVVDVDPQSSGYGHIVGQLD